MLTQPSPDGSTSDRGHSGSLRTLLWSLSLVLLGGACGTASALPGALLSGCSPASSSGLPPMPAGPGPGRAELPLGCSLACPVGTASVLTRTPGMPAAGRAGQSCAAAGG